jgi:uncharacterized protein with von Willebrand factor type A (vWA) domain
MTAPIPLDGLFFRLVREGFPLGIRDLNEALCALEAGFGTGNRENLMWLCRALWARTEEEDRRIGILFQQHLPRPTAEEVAALTGRPLPEKPAETDAAPREDPAAHELPNQRANTPALEISGAEQPGGIGLPRAAVAVSRAESFILAPKPLVSLRSCVIAWRRYRRPIRSGPKVELDLEQTIAAKAAQGFLPAPVLVSRRGNQARIVLLVDSGPSMASWAYSTAMLVESLRESRLGVSAVFYFHEAPDRLFERPGLTGPLPLRAALDRFPETPVVVASDGGSARGGFDQRRIRATRESLGRFGLSWRPVAWLNPMPKGRWRGTSAAAIARLPGVSMLPFTADGLIQAIDLLRGQRHI